MELYSFALTKGISRIFLGLTSSNNQETNMANIKTIEKLDPREIRRKLGMNQLQFWSLIGVTQSGGSRYESGRNMPKPVRELLRLVHVEHLDLKNFKREDQEVIEFL